MAAKQISGRMNRHSSQGEPTLLLPRLEVGPRIPENRLLNQRRQQGTETGRVPEKMEIQVSCGSEYPSNFLLKMLFDCHWCLHSQWGSQTGPLRCSVCR